MSSLITILHNYKIRAFFTYFFPWLLGLAILAILSCRIPLADLRQALARGPWLLVGIYVVAQVLVTLLADGYATRISLAVTGVDWRLGKVVLTRGTTYLLGLVNYALGQGGIGYYLYQDGIKADRVTGIVLFMLITNFGLICLLAALGVMAQGLAHYPHVVSLAVWFLFLLTIVYLTIIAAAPKKWREFRGLAPLWQAGVSGHLTAAAGRLPHLGILVLVIGALPLTPVGLGTTNAAQVIFFSPYAPDATPETRAAAVLAFSLIYYALGMASQLAVGVSSWIWLRRMNNNEGDEVT